MARGRRPDFEGAYHHVMARGNRGQDIFMSDKERYDFITILGEICEAFGWRIYAYCLMSNHYHLLIHTPNAGLSDGMRLLNGKFTQRSNQRNGTYGHVFQGRFKSILVEDDTYLLELFRYIYMNPVKDGLVRSPQAWKWSSYRYHAGYQHHQEPPPWLEVVKVRKLFSGGNTKDGRTMADFVKARTKQSEEGKRMLEALVNSGGVLGSDTFMRRHHSSGRALLTDRNGRIVKASQSGMRQQEIAEKFGLHQSTVARILSKT